MPETNVSISDKPVRLPVGGALYPSLFIRRNRVTNSQKPPFTEDLKYSVSEMTERYVYGAAGYRGSGQQNMFPAREIDSVIGDACGEASIHTVLNRLLDEARHKAHGRFADGDLSLGVDGAEIGQSFGMITSTVGKITKAYAAIKRGNIGSALHHILGYHPRKRIPKSAWNIPSNLRGKRSGAHSKSISERLKAGALSPANAWLEVTYGWKPLINSVYGVASAVTDGLRNTSSDVIRIAAGATEQLAGTGYSADGRVWKTTISGICRAGVVLKVRVTNIATRIAAALGLINPFTIAWELVPFSFVVDWFLPIGRTLATISYYAGCSVRGCSSTKADLTVKTELNPDNDYFYPVYQNAVGYLTARRFSRNVPENGVPTLSWGKIAPKLGVSRLTSALALLTQTFLGKGK